MHLTAVGATMCAVIVLSTIATQKAIFVDAVKIQSRQQQFDHEIEIEKQNIIELPLLVQITPKQNEKPQLLIIEIRLPDQPASPYRSHFITQQLNKQDVATPGNYGTTSPIGTSPVNGFVAPFQGSVNTQLSSTYTNGHLRPSLIHLSEKPLQPGPPYQGLALSHPVNPSGANALGSPQPSFVSQPQAPSLSNTASPFRPTPSSSLPSVPSQTAGTLTNAVNTIDIRTPSANVGSNAFSPQYTTFGALANLNTNAQPSLHPQQSPSFNTGFGSLTNPNPATPSLGAFAALPPPPPPASALALAPFGSNAQTGFGAFAAIAAPDLTGNRQSPASNSIFGSPAGALPQPQAPQLPISNSIFGSPAGVLPQPQAPQLPTSNSIFGSPAGVLPQPQAPPLPGASSSSGTDDGTLDNRIQPNVLKSTVG